MLDMTLDYGPLVLEGITDVDGNPAEIDGKTQFRLEQEDGTPITDCGVILTTVAGDPHVLPDGSPVPEGSILYSPDPAKGAVQGATFTIRAHVDPNLNPTITDDAVVATVTDVLATPAGPAAVARLNLGAGMARV